MTRFMISLEQGVDLVKQAFENSIGGEIYVKKIPSMKVTEIAKTIFQSDAYDEIGIRLGEKMHEQMISLEDSMTTYEKDEPAKIKADRIKRIARGSGVKEKDVRELIGQWNRSRKMMKGMSGNRKMNKQMKRMMRNSEMDMDDFGM